MPVYKYRSIEEMPDTPWRTPGDPELYRALASLSEMSRRLHPRRFPAGVYRHRSIEEMNAQRDRWDVDHASTLTSTNVPANSSPKSRRSHPA